MHSCLSPFYKDTGRIELSIPTSKVIFGGSKEECDFWKDTLIQAEEPVLLLWPLKCMAAAFPMGPPGILHASAPVLVSPS